MAACDNDWTVKEFAEFGAVDGVGVRHGIDGTGDPLFDEMKVGQSTLIHTAHQRGVQASLVRVRTSIQLDEGEIARLSG